MFDNVINLCCIQAYQLSASVAQALSEEQRAGEHLRYVDYIFSLNSCK